jgi:2-succinyl-6-hydroxy-2,4-cyclohexadiene-1-carboxylate synthase
MTAPYSLRLGGQETPLLFFHGFLGRPSAWDRVLDTLGADSPAGIATLPGHGPDPWKPAADTFESAVQALFTNQPFADARPWLIGYSMGARIALALLRAHPESFSGAILIGVHPGLRSESERQERIRADEARAGCLTINGLPAFVTEWEAQPLFVAQTGLPQDVLRSHRARRLDHTPDGVAWALRTIGLGQMPPLWPLPARRPVHLLTGEHDVKFRAVAHDMVQQDPTVIHRVISGAGHDVVLEQPAALADQIRRVLTGAREEA